MNYPFKKRNRVTQPWSHVHYGLDIVGDDGSDVLAICAGKVVASAIVTNRTDKTWEWGNYVRVDDEAGNRFFYCHLHSRSVKVGQKINAGDKIGIMGNTGKSFGAHLHLQIRDKNNRELNVPQFIGMVNKTGTYIENNLLKAQLWTCTVGPVSRGDRNTIEGLAKNMQVSCIISAQGCANSLVRCNIGPVSKGDLTSVQTLAKKLCVSCAVKVVM